MRNIPVHAQHPCVFIDHTGSLNNIIVPFNFALISQNSTRARDLQLYKELKIFMREENFDSEKLESTIDVTCSNVKTNEVQLLILEMMMMNKHVTQNNLLTTIQCITRDSSGKNLTFVHFKKY